MKGHLREFTLAASLWLCATATALPGEEPGPEGNSSGPIWQVKPTLEQLYQGYEPSFSRYNRARVDSRDGQKLKDSLRFSRQKLYMNMADVQMDAQVRPVIGKANELAAKEEYRKAAELYRRVLQEYGDDLYQIAEEGIFIPAALYVQRRILAFPQKELAYYRVVHDAAARDIFERAVRRYSIFDYREIATKHLATSYGDDALFALGNAAVDAGRYDEARRCYEEIVTYHGEKDEDSDDVELPRDQVWVRLAVCLRHLGLDKEYREAVKRIGNRNEATVASLLSRLEQFKYDDVAVRQREGRRSARFDAADDTCLSDPLPYTFSANRGEWETQLMPRPARYPKCMEPEALPWATETDLIYKDMNVIYSRSLLTGGLNWAFGPGGSSQDWDLNIGHGSLTTRFYPEQAILVHEGAVLGHMFVYGPSLVAVDQNTGQMLWCKGPMAARTEEEWLDRYQAAPAATRGAVIAPVVHDDIRGRSHISSTAELAAFDTRTGGLLWRTTLSRISPLKITQSRYPRKIRILSTTPLVYEGTVYHVTNAGVVAAVDAQTGDIRWLTRYPQRSDVLDNLVNLTETYPWRSVPPLVRGDKVYVTPVDSPYLLCLDKETGRILWTATQEADSLWTERGAGQFGDCWRMAGFSPDGTLALTGFDVAFLNPDTGKKAWNLDIEGGKSKGLRSGITGEGEDYWTKVGNVRTLTRFTKDGKAWFTCQQWYLNPYPCQGPFNSEFCLDIKARELKSQRRWYHPPAFIHDHPHAPPIAKRVVNEEPEEFHPATRMTVTRWGVPFEVNVKFDSIVVRYDRKKLEGVLSKREDINALFARAEMARKNGDAHAAIRLYEQCRGLLPSEESDTRRNINLRLYPLYVTLAQWGYQSGDLDAVEEACRRMGASASNPAQELRALLAYSELHERRGSWEQATGVLQNVGRHYWREPLAANGLEVGNRREFVAKAEKALENLIGEVPALFAGVAREIGAREKHKLDDSFLSVAEMGADRVVETRSLVADRLLGMVGRSPETFRKRYEEMAKEELKRADGIEVGERLLWCWPGTGAGRAKLGELYTKASAEKGADGLGLKWRLDDAGTACGLKQGTDSKAATAPSSGNQPPGTNWASKEEENGEPDIVRLALPQRNGTEATAHLLFAGGRRKSAYGNRFTIGCWDMKAGRKAWETGSILLGGKTMGEEGYEVGFEEVLLAGDLAVVHGRYDVIAVRWAADQDAGEGKTKDKKWHFRVPLGFEIQSVGLEGRLLVLCGRSGTVALLAETGDIVWDSPEDGEFYAGPFFHGETVLTVRSSPSGVSFRRLGSGRLLNWLKLPGLTANRKHPLYAGEAGSTNPAAAEAAEAYPVAFGGGRLAVVDGRNYHVVDVEKMELAWSTPATKLDPSSDAAYRLWLDGERLLVLKPYYMVLENAVFDAASGEMLWRRREGGKKAEQKLKKQDLLDNEEGKEAVGLLLSSMTFLGGKVYGIRYEMGPAMVALVGMDPVTGNEVMRVEQKGYSDPEAYVEPSSSKDCVTVRVQDGTRFEVWQVDVARGKLVQKLVLSGNGRLGEYGDASAVWQGPHLAIWTHEKRMYSTPTK